MTTTIKNFLKSDNLVFGLLMILAAALLFGTIFGNSYFFPEHHETVKIICMSIAGSTFLGFCHMISKSI